jgi:hypothetical protein
LRNRIVSHPEGVRLLPAMLAELETLAGREVGELGTVIRAPGITLE